MKTIKTIPIYNKKSQKLTSITTEEYDRIDLEQVDPHFFDVQGEFILVRPPFFRQDKLIKSIQFYVSPNEISLKRDVKANYKKVIIILDAPHKYEYDYSNKFKALYPIAKSFSGFEMSFNSLMQMLNDDSDQQYQVTLYNAVPFQTSLHYLFKRNANERTKFNFWLYGWWTLKYHRELEIYLNQHKFDYYINAGARAYKTLISNKLSTLVNVEYQTHHPASGFWNRKEPKFGLKKIIHLDDSHYLFRKEEDVF